MNQSYTYTPNLQLKVLDYFRLLTTGTNTQVILATHSPAMVESAGFEELFLLRPSELLTSKENQLVQIADNEEKLRYLRENFGTTSNLTALQPIIIVEGISENDASRVAADRKLYRALHSGFDQVTIISGGGKGQCKALLEVLQPALVTFSDRLKAVALLDRDQALEDKNPNVHLLPVSMIENFLLDPESIWEAIQSVIEKTVLQSVTDIENAINSLIDDIEAEELERRTIINLGIFYYRPKTPIAEIKEQAVDYAQKLISQYSADNILKARDEAQIALDEFNASNKRREMFHGKILLDNFFKQHLHNTGLQKTIFKFETARHAKRRKIVTEFFDEFFKSIRTDELSAARRD